MAVTQQHATIVWLDRVWHRPVKQRWVCICRLARFTFRLHPPCPPPMTRPACGADGGQSWPQGCGLWTPDTIRKVVRRGLTGGRRREGRLVAREGRSKTWAVPGPRGPSRTPTHWTQLLDPHEATPSRTPVAVHLRTAVARTTGSLKALAAKSLPPSVDRRWAAWSSPSNGPRCPARFGTCPLIPPIVGRRRLA